MRSLNVMGRAFLCVLPALLGCGGSTAARCPCPELQDPACGVDRITYSNACNAACAGVQTAHQGACVPQDGPGCSCPVADDPVCADSGITYASACNAACAGARISHAGHCMSDAGGAGTGGRAGAGGGAGTGGSGGMAALSCRSDLDCPASPAAPSTRCCVQPSLGAVCTPIYFGSHAMTPCEPPAGNRDRTCGNTTCGTGQWCFVPCCGTPGCQAGAPYCGPPTDVQPGCLLLDGFRVSCQCA